MEEQEFKEKLNPEQYRVMRQKGTEVAFTGQYWDSDEAGLYVCAACGRPLFLSLDKLESEDGWPSFSRPAFKKNVELVSEAGEQTEVRCKKCSSHIGYLFPGDEQIYRINSICLDFKEMPELDSDDDSDNGGRKTDKKTQDSKANQSPTATLSIKNILLVLGGGILGAGILGFVLSMNGSAFMCQYVPATQESSTLASTTTGDSLPSSSLPKTLQTSASLVSPNPGGASLPKNTGSATTSAPQGTPPVATSSDPATGI